MNGGKSTVAIEPLLIHLGQLSLLSVSVLGSEYQSWLGVMYQEGVLLPRVYIIGRASGVKYCLSYHSKYNLQVGYDLLSPMAW